MDKEQIKEFKKVLRKGKYTVYTVLNHVSISGMFRRISAYVIINNEPRCINWQIDKLGLYPRDKNHEGLRVSGCGMDMGFDIVYNLGSMLYPKGFKSSNRNRRNGMKPTDKGFDWDNDGGYRLTQRWM